MTPEMQGRGIHPSSLVECAFRLGGHVDHLEFGRECLASTKSPTAFFENGLSVYQIW